MTHVTAAFYFDPEVNNWGFVVPELNIVGGGDHTWEAAEDHCRDAIDFTLGTLGPNNPDLEFGDLPEVRVVTYCERQPKTGPP